VIRTDDGAVSLLVDEMFGDVLDVDAATYERPPENLDPAAREIIHGVYKLKDGCCWFSIRSERWHLRSEESRVQLKREQPCDAAFEQALVRKDQREGIELAFTFFFRDQQVLERP